MRLKKQRNQCPQREAERNIANASFEKAMLELQQSCHFLPQMDEQQQMVDGGFSTTVSTPWLELASQKGQIGITRISEWVLPYSNSKTNEEAAQRGLDFTFGCVFRFRLGVGGLQLMDVALRVTGARKLQSDDVPKFLLSWFPPRVTMTKRMTIVMTLD
ncbi:hypothetical protein Vadar_019225 [Vaccinium darrowii]|uniref:Uncharacterized protein n=1 Tax=Vaccinium darrowii TaxID=229202 RepID=A0ACB7Z7C4_9ERIC|nr:hypothetical protein Vadar_019225 [Vaccinium darrowii]